MSLLEVARPTPGSSVTPAPKLTLRSVRAELDAIHMSIRYDADRGEYRVNFKNGREESAGYETSLAAARDTAIAMDKRLWQQIKAESAD